MGELVHEASFCACDRVQPCLCPRKAIIDLNNAGSDREAACPEGDEVRLGLGSARIREAVEVCLGSGHTGVSGHQQADTPLPTSCNSRRDDQLPVFFLYRPGGGWNELQQSYTVRRIGSKQRPVCAPSRPTQSERDLDLFRWEGGGSRPLDEEPVGADQERF